MTQEKVEAVNKLLLEGEPGNISVDDHGSTVYTGYKPQAIADAMNKVFWGEWGFDELSNRIEGGEKGGIAIAQVRVWLKGVDFQPTAWGQNRVTRGDLGDALKGAQTDAVKKALSYFSVGNRAYQGLLSDKPAQQRQSVAKSNNRATEPRPQAQQAASTHTNLSDIPSVRMLRETAQALALEWETVLANTFERSIKDGKVTLEALKNKGNELPPEYCKRIAAYLQTKQAA